MKTSRRLVASALTFGLGLTFWGCSTDTITDQPVPNGALIPNPAVPVAPGVTGISFPLFDTTTFQLPLPSDVIRNNGVADPTKKGLVDFPNVAPFLAEPFTSAETIRGFSTTGNIIIPFSGRIDAASVTPQSLLLVEGGSSTVTPEPTGSNASIPYILTVRNADPSTSGNSTIVMTPLRPLKPAVNYYVTMTTAIQGNGRGIGTAPAMQASKSRTPLIDGSGNNFVFPVPNDTALTLEGLRQAYQPFWARAESILGTDRANIPIVFRFGTEPELAALATLRGIAAGLVAADLSYTNTVLGVNANETLAPGSVDAFYAGTNPANRSTLDLTTVAHASIDRISTGTIQITNYYGPGGFWVGEGFPGLPPIVNQGKVPRPYRACLPAGNGPFPVIIYQHGIGRSKDDVFLVANSFCAQGFAVIGIDLVFHGPAATAFPPVPVVPPPVGPITAEDAFFNLSNPRAARDNFRQSAVDLHYLTATLLAQRANLDANAATGSAVVQPNGQVGCDIDPTRVRFVGHSIGGFVGGVYTATEPGNQFAVLAQAGGRLMNTLFLSGNRGPVFKARLAASGVVEGTQAFDLFNFAAQLTLDDGDPLNYAAPAIEGILKSQNPADFAPRSSRVLLQEAENDGTIPNSSTRDLATAFAYDANAIGFSATRPTTFRHVQTVLNAVATLVAVPAPYLGPDASGLAQFQPAGHEGLLGIEPTTTTPTAVVNQMRAQITTFLNTTNIQAGQ